MPDNNNDNDSDDDNDYDGEGSVDGSGGDRRGTTRGAVDDIEDLLDDDLVDDLDDGTATPDADTDGDVDADVDAGDGSGDDGVLPEDEAAGDGDEVDDLFADASSMESGESDSRGSLFDDPGDGEDAGSDGGESTADEAFGTESPGVFGRLTGIASTGGADSSEGTADEAAGSDGDDGRDVIAAGRQAGAAAVHYAVILPVWAAAKFAVGLSRGVVLAVTRVLPKGDLFWRGVLGTALKGMYRTSGADAIGFVTRGNGTIDPRPVKRKQTENGAMRWRVADAGDEFAEGVGGGGFERIRNVPVAFFDEDDYYRNVGPQMRAAEVVDLGQTQHLYADAVFDAELTLDVTPDASGGGQPAVADGGLPEDLAGVELTAADLRDLGALDDVVLDYESPGDAVGMRRRWSKVKELYFEFAPTEEMEAQEKRGRIAESDPEAERERWQKTLLYIVLAVLVARSPELAALLLGKTGAGGGVSGLVPFVIGSGVL